LKDDFLNVVVIATMHSFKNRCILNCRLHTPSHTYSMYSVCISNGDDESVLVKECSLLQYNCALYWCGLCFDISVDYTPTLSICFF